MHCCKEGCRSKADLSGLLHFWVLQELAVDMERCDALLDEVEPRGRLRSGND